MPSFGGLTFEEIEVACWNYGIDMKCGSCAMLFYTGYGGHEHCDDCRTTSLLRSGPVTMAIDRIGVGMSDFAEARKLGAQDGSTWVSSRATDTLRAMLWDASGSEVAKKQAMFRLVTFLHNTFRNRDTEQVLREALGIGPSDDLAAAQEQYEIAWLDAARSQLSKDP